MVSAKVEICFIEVMKINVYRKCAQNIMRDCGVNKGSKEMQLQLEKDGIFEGFFKLILVFIMGDMASFYTDGDDLGQKEN